MFNLKDLLSTLTVEDVERFFSQAEEIKLSWDDSESILDVSGQKTKGFFKVETGDQVFRLGANILIKALLRSDALDKVKVAKDAISHLGKIRQALSRQRALANQVK